jgi:hypothetical protein
VKIKVTYCGGCNSGYDRAELVEKLKAEFPHMDFYITTSSNNCGMDFVLAVCGCPVRCAARENENGKYGAFTVSSPHDFPEAKKRLLSLNTR